MPEGFAFFMPSPADIQRARDRHDMLMEDFKNRTQALIEGLGPEDLATLRQMFDQCASDKRQASFLSGVASTVLHLKHPDRCENCGGDKTHGMLPTDDGEAPAEQPADQPDIFDLLAEDHQPDPEANYQENLKTYGVTPIYSDQPLGMVKCDNCGMTFVSLEDRMMKPPGKEGCGGCIQKEKWG